MSEDLITRAAHAAYPELFDPNNSQWFARPPQERAYHQTQILARIAAAVRVVQAEGPTEPAQDPEGVTTLTMFAPQAKIVVATLGIMSFLDEDGTENYAMSHSTGTSRATLLGMLAMASHEIVTAPGKGD